MVKRDTEPRQGEHLDGTYCISLVEAIDAVGPDALEKLFGSKTGQERRGGCCQ